MQDVLPIIISGFASGSAYSLIALGKVIIFKSTGTVNFAIADIGVLSVFVAFSALGLGLPKSAALVLSVVLAGGLGILTDRLVIRQLGHGRTFVFISLVAMIGLGILIRAAVSEIWGHQPQPFPPLIPGVLVIAGIAIAWNKLIATALALTAMAAIAWFFGRTRLGLAMRANAEDHFAARMVGLNASGIAMLAWFIGCGLSALAIFFLAAESSLSPSLGIRPLFRALAGVFLGGLTSMPGAAAGGFAIGMLDGLAGRYVSANFRDTIVFAVIVLILFLRPAGLFGSIKSERV